MMDYLEIITAYCLKIGCYNKRNEKMKVYEIPLTLTEHDSDIKIKACCTKQSLVHLLPGFVLIVG